ncbi:hypothetical protein Bbelb_251800 [Branchiostoma belcheri]|nr:hypothetical protein Bbelb_251800 [Branchiostoma belcheri]
MRHVYNRKPFNLQPNDPEPTNLEPFNLEPTNLEPTNLEPFNLEPTNPQPFDPQPQNPQPKNPQPFNPQPFNPRPFNPQPLNTQPLNPQPIDPQPFNPQPFNPQPFNLRPFNPQPFNPQPLNPQPFNLRPFNPQPIDPQPLNPQPFNLQPFNPQPFNPQPLIPQPIDPQPFNPQPFNPQPFNLKPLNPQPLNPRPSNTTKVINPHPYKFTINNPGKCRAGKDVFLLIMVISAPGDADLRHAIRKTWGQETIDADIVMKTVFTVGIPNNASVQKNLEQENTLNQDIIQENFVDSYRNLTLKTVMCLKWASEFCPGAKFVMKVDDDTFVNIYSLVRHLKRLSANKTTRLVTGHVNSGVEPIRDLNTTDKNKRWYISTKDYPWETFPDYASGLAYVMSGDVVRPLYEASWTVKYLFLEDVFLGHCMEKLGIKPVHHGGFIPYQDWTTPYCTSVELLAAHWSKIPGSIYAAWSRLSSMCVGVASINDDKLYEWQNLIKQQQAKKARLNL